MISLLRGKLHFRAPFTLVIEAAGVGYEVHVTQEAYDRASVIGEEYEIVTRLIVREDSMTLFGFASIRERALFDLLVAISGIGPKTAIAILSSVGETDLREAIRSSDI